MEDRETLGFRDLPKLQAAGSNIYSKLKFYRRLSILLGGLLGLMILKELLP